MCLCLTSGYRAPPVVLQTELIPYTSLINTTLHDTGRFFSYFLQLCKFYNTDQYFDTIFAFFSREFWDLVKAVYCKMLTMCTRALDDEASEKKERWKPGLVALHHNINFLFAFISGQISFMQEICRFSSHKTSRYVLIFLQFSSCSKLLFKFA
jgi:hypothetical protein